VQAISIRGITKRFGDFTAVNNLHLEAAQGEILGFLGLNGAGKTTTIRILLDLLRPDGGSARIFGHDCQTEGLMARSKIGYLPAEMGIYSDLTGIDVLDLLAGLGEQIPDDQRRHELQERFQLSESELGCRIREYSTGMKRKLGLVQAFQADPQLLILDEPTEGLDPLMQEAFYGLLADVKKRGGTVFMSSHLLSEVGRVCDRIALLRKGELAFVSTVEECHALAARRVRVSFAEDVTLPRELPPGHEIVSTTPRYWDLTVGGPLGPLIQTISALPVRDIQVAEPKLEDVVLKYYRKDVE
jgi:ABC-2 type transport system ATP-binding protein